MKEPSITIRIKRRGKYRLAYCVVEMDRTHTKFGRQERVAIFENWLKRLGIHIKDLAFYGKLTNFINCEECCICKEAFAKLCGIMCIPCPTSNWQSEGICHIYPCPMRRIAFDVTCDRAELAFWVNVYWVKDAKPVVARIRSVIHAALQSRMEMAAKLHEKHMRRMYKFMYDPTIFV